MCPVIFQYQSPCTDFAQNMLPIIKNTNVIAPGMYKVHTKPNQTRTSQLHQDIRKPNKRVSFSTGVIPTTSVSRPQPKSNQLEDRVMSNNSKGKEQKLVEIILFIVDSGCSKHMTGNLKLLTNFVEKFLGTVKFGNDQIAPILGYGDLVQGTITIKRGNDLLTVSCTDFVFLTLTCSTTPNPICLMAKATSSQAWLWHRRLSHLNFDTINLLSKNNIVNGLPKLKFARYLWILLMSGESKKTSFPLDYRAQKDGLQFYTWTYVVQCGLSLFGFLCYIVKDGENLDKMKEKGDACIFVGYSTQSKAYRVFNKRTRIIVETIHVNFDELPQMGQIRLVLTRSTLFDSELEQDSLSSSPQSPENLPQVAETFSLYMLLTNPDKRQQHNITHTSTTTDVSDPPPLNIHSTHQTLTQVPTVTAPENIIEAETNIENAQCDKDEFINIFSTPVQEQGETSSRHVVRSNMHTFYQTPSLRTTVEMCMFALTVSQTEPKNIKEAMADSAWIESMQEELHQFDRLDVWELVDRPLCKNVINLKWLWKNKRDEAKYLSSQQIASLDISFGSTNPKLSKQFGNLMHSKFDMSMMGVLKFFLGIQIHQSPRGIFINQAKYAQEILKKHGMNLCDSIGTPMATKHLDADLSGTPVDQTKYRSMVGALMYLTTSRPNIVHATCIVVSYQSETGLRNNLTVVK
ncbi:retrovirus-related pol polyprotein from transposon TNT 1-94 [Tanacetum coccineum]